MTETLEDQLKAVNEQIDALRARREALETALNERLFGIKVDDRVLYKSKWYRITGFFGLGLWPTGKRELRSGGSLAQYDTNLHDWLTKGTK